MQTSKTISIVHTNVEYIFIVNLATKQLSLVLQREVGSSLDSIVPLHLTPDVVQIKFYRTLNRLSNEYNATHKSTDVK